MDSYIIFNIALGFTTLNTVLSLGLGLSYIRHWARRGTKGGMEGETFFVFECIFSLFTLIPLHGLNTNSTAASHSLIKPLMTEQAFLAPFALK